MSSVSTTLLPQPRLIHLIAPEDYKEHAKIYWLIAAALLWIRNPKFLDEKCDEIVYVVSRWIHYYSCLMFFGQDNPYYVDYRKGILYQESKGIYPISRWQRIRDECVAANFDASEEEMANCAATIHCGEYVPSLACVLDYMEYAVLPDLLTFRPEHRQAQEKRLLYPLQVGLAIPTAKLCDARSKFSEASMLVVF